MSQRNQFLTVLLIVSGILSALAVNFLFYQEESLNSPLAARSEHRFIARIIRFRQFDSVIVGSSMSQNFRCTEFDGITGGTSYKFTLSGCSIAKSCFIAESAIRRRKIRTVLMDLNNSLLMREPPESDTGDIIEADTGLAGDLRDGVSLWSLSDRRKYYMNRLRGGKAGKMTRDEMFCWAEDHPCGKAHLARFIANREKYDTAAISPVFLERNIEGRLLPLFRSHPEVNFILFLPPFTPFAFADRPDLILARRAVMDRFLTLPNVKVYDFQGVREVCTDYDNYRDVMHYSARISSWILEQIKLDNCRVTPENRKEFEMRFSRMMDSFNYLEEVAAMDRYHAENSRSGSGKGASVRRKR